MIGLVTLSWSHAAVSWIISSSVAMIDVAASATWLLGDGYCCSLPLYFSVCFFLRLACSVDCLSFIWTRYALTRMLTMLGGLVVLEKLGT